MSDAWGVTSPPMPMLIARIDDDACDRLVAVFEEPEGFAVPLDAERPINQQLFEADEIVLVRDDQTVLCRVAGHEPAGHELIRRLSVRVGCHISDATEVLHLVPEVERVDPFLVVAVDAGERAGAALGVASELGAWFGYDVRHAAVVDPHDAETREAVQHRLEADGVDDPEWVAADRIVDWATAVAATGGLIVGAAHGHWSEASLVHGLVPGLIAHDCASIVAVGPRVPPDWSPTASDPVLVAVDASEHAEKVVEELQPLLHPPRARLLVVHVAGTEDEAESHHDVAERIARDINERWGVPVRSRVVTDSGFDRARAIADVAADEHAQLIVTHSWHRSVAGRPQTASLSGELVAHAACPVIIFRGDADS